MAWLSKTLDLVIRLYSAVWPTRQMNQNQLYYSKSAYFLLGCRRFVAHEISHEIAYVSSVAYLFDLTICAWDIDRLRRTACSQWIHEFEQGFGRDRRQIGNRRRGRKHAYPFAHTD